MTQPDLTVFAVRYCDHVPTVAALFEMLGLSRRLSSTGDGYVDLVAGDGLLMLHSAGTAQTATPAGQASLSFEVTDLDATAEALAELDPVTWDESYGRQLGVRDPHGDGIWITEALRDVYGYRAHDATPNDLNLLAVRFTADFDRDAAFYRRLGFAARPDASEHFAPLAGTAPARGVIGLHPPNEPLPAAPNSPGDPLAPPVLINVSFETHEPLGDLAERLTACGVEARIVDGPAPNVQVVDPEGVEIEIHVAP